MKKAIGYARISTNDQSRFSIPGQVDSIKDYCEKNNIGLEAMFCDEGESARNFDRPDWLQLEKFIAKNYQLVDYLVVIKYDRFIRNALDGLKMIEQLEERYNIRIISIMEPIQMHPKSPYFFKIRADILTSGQFERLVIQERTKFGIHHANKQGRYVNNAPFGYKNARDEKNNPILVVDIARANLIRQVFARFLEGVPPEEIRRQLKPAGFTPGGRSAIARVIKNATYAGLILVREFYDEPERLVKGIHEAIVSEETFFQAQSLLKQPAGGRRILSEDFPLRGLLKHTCGRPLTGAFSKGKKKLVGYYRCHGDNANLNSARLHAQFDGVLKELSWQPHHLAYLKHLLEKGYEEQREGQQQQLVQKKLALQQVETRLTNLEEKVLDGIIDSATYKKWRNKLIAEQVMLAAQIREIEIPAGTVWEHYADRMYLLEDISAIYQGATVAHKQAFVRGVFNNELRHDGNIYRTPYLFSIFQHKALALKEKGLLIYEQPEEKTMILEESTQDGS